MNTTNQKSQSHAGIAKLSLAGIIGLGCTLIGYTGLSTSKKLVTEGAKNLGWGK